MSKCTSPTLKQEELENTIIELLKERLLNSCEIDDLVKKVNEQYKTLYNDSFENIHSLEQDLKDKENQIDNITNAIASGVSSSSLLLKLQQLEDIKINLEEQLRLSNNINKTPEINADMIKYFLKKDTDRLIKNVEAKEIIRKWIKK